jgi:23S rRNA pseudouridine2605 synthase
VATSVKRKSKAPSVEGEQRLHVRIAHAGVCSRRQAEKYIAEGRVDVNGEIVTEMGRKVGPNDDVRFDGMPCVEAKHYTMVLNKPTGCVTTLFDPQRRPTIVKYLPDMGVQLKPVGRLDMDTEGLLIVSNDGELSQRLAHPRYEVEKEYRVIVRGIPDEKALNKLRNGIYIEGGKTKPARVDVIHAEPSTNTTGLTFVLHEGRKRQIRLMCEAAGHDVISLKRLRIGPLTVKGMRAGECRMLTKSEVDSLRKLVKLPTN